MHHRYLSAQFLSIFVYVVSSDTSFNSAVITHCAHYTENLSEVSPLPACQRDGPEKHTDRQRTYRRAWSNVFHKEGMDAYFEIMEHGLLSCTADLATELWIRIWIKPLECGRKRAGWAAAGRGG